MTATTDTVDERLSLLGGESRTRGMFGSLGVLRGLGLVGLGILAVVALVITKSAVLAVVFGLLAIAGFILSRRRTHEGEAWTGSLSEQLRWRVARRAGWDRYDPEEGGLPLELGQARFMAVSAVENGPELSVTGHGLESVTTVLEIVGGGEGMHEIILMNATGRRFGALLSRLARPDMPVDQVDFSTRVLPVDAAMYRSWSEDRLRSDLRPELRESMKQLADTAEWSGEGYRSWITIQMSRARLAARAQRLGLSVNEGTIAEMAFDVTGQVSTAVTRAGMTVRAGLGPRRLGALIRHLYVPSIEMDDQRGLTGARDGFVAYNGEGPAHRLGFEAMGPDGSTWWHATASIPREGLPKAHVGTRWLECLVTNVSPSVTRTVTAQHRLVAKPVARTRAATALTMDKAAIIRDQKRGVVSTGEKEAQATIPQLVLNDLLNEDAAGDQTALRVTVSAPTFAELLDARETVEAAALDGNIEKVRWHDTRHHQAHVLTLPLAKGVSTK